MVFRHHCKWKKKFMSCLKMSTSSGKILKHSSTSFFRLVVQFDWFIQSGTESAWIFALFALHFKATSLSGKFCWWWPAVGSNRTFFTATEWQYRPFAFCITGKSICSILYPVYKLFVLYQTSICMHIPGELLENSL